MPKREKLKFIGSFLTTYYETKQLADGGNSTVYEVKDDENNFSALKLLNKKINTESKKRFKNEINYCMKDQHVNILKVIDNGVIMINDEPHMFYIMPLYPKNLSHIIAENIDDDLKMDYFNQILEGVKHFHNSGNYHRDLKPENILVNDELKSLVIADFGISHFNEEDLHTIVETKLDSRMANFQYPAPEQKEKGAKVDHRADIYALGLILNEMFTKKIINGSSYRKIADVSPNYSFLDDVVEMMIKQEKEERIQSVVLIQHEINLRIKLYNDNEELKKLKEIKIKEDEEQDILILNPPVLMDFEFDEENYRLSLILSESVNRKWVDCVLNSSRSFVGNYDISAFDFHRNMFSVVVAEGYINRIQDIINSFKEWIVLANKSYPVVVKQERYQLKIEQERKLQDEIKRKEKITNIISSIKI